MICERIKALLEEYEGEELPRSLLRRTRSECGCESCSTVYTIGQVRYVIEQMLRAELEQEAPPSPEGFRLELARLGLLGKRAIDEWKKHESSERRHIRVALLAWVRKRLTPLQLAILRLGYAPLGYETNVRWYVPVQKLHRLAVPVGEQDGVDAQGNPLLCGWPQKNGFPCARRRVGGEVRCAAHLDPKSRPEVWVTDDGATVVQTCEDGRTAVVKGSRALLRSPEQIGRDLERCGFEPLSERQVRSQITSAYESIRMMPEVGLLTPMEETA